MKIFKVKVWGLDEKDDKKVNLLVHIWFFWKTRKKSWMWLVFRSSRGGYTSLIPWGNALIQMIIFFLIPKETLLSNLNIICRE
jgi:hypothetical protein